MRRSSKLVSLVLPLALSLLMCIPGGLAGGVTDPLLNELGTLPLVKEPVSLSIGIATSVNVLDYEDNVLTKYAQEKTGVSLEWVHFPATDAASKVDLLVNSGSELPDILTIGLTTTNLLRYGSAGAVIPLNDYYADLGFWFDEACTAQGYDPQYLINIAKSADGNLYADFVYAYAYQNVYSLRAFINHDWLDALGLATPTTSDELYDVLTAFRDRDPNGNQLQDEIPLMGSDSTWRGNALMYLMNMFLYCSGAESLYLPLNETGGKIDVAYDKEEYRQFLIYANKLVREGLLSPLTFTQDSAQFNAILSTDPASVGIVVRGGAQAIFFGNSPSLYAPLEAIAGPSGAQYASTFPPAVAYKHAITSDCQNPEIAFLWMMYRHSDPIAYQTARYGEYGVDWEFAEEGQISMFDMLGYKPYIKLHNSIWGMPSNHYWGGLWHMSQQGPETFLEVFSGDTTNDEYNYAVGYALNQKHGIAFEDVVPTLVYTLEEAETWNDARTSLENYVKEARTLFALGEMDPEKDWDAYLKELNNLQYKEILAIAQTAYDRMLGD